MRRKSVGEMRIKERRNFCFVKSLCRYGSYIGGRCLNRVCSSFESLMLCCS